MAQSTSEKFKQQLLAYRLDVVRWAEENIEIRRPNERQIAPLVLQGHQKDFLHTATRRGGDGSGQLVHTTCVASWP